MSVTREREREREEREIHKSKLERRAKQGSPTKGEGSVQ
jgi:hypothetical protein